MDYPDLFQTPLPKSFTDCMEYRCPRYAQWRENAPWIYIEELQKETRYGTKVNYQTIILAFPITMYPGISELVKYIKQHHGEGKTVELVVTDRVFYNCLPTERKHHLPMIRLGGFKEADLDNLSTLDTSASYGGVIWSIVVDDTHIYVGGQTTQTVRKYLKSDLSYVGESASYGGTILSIAIDDTYIYVGGGTTRRVRKYLKSNLSYANQQSSSYGDDIYAIAVDDTHVYVGGVTYNSVRKYLKSDLSYVGETPSYGGAIYAIVVDDTYIYAGGSTTQTVRKYLKSDLSYVSQTSSYGGYIRSIVIG